MLVSFWHVLFSICTISEFDCLMQKSVVYVAKWTIFTELSLLNMRKPSVLVNKKKKKMMFTYNIKFSLVVYWKSTWMQSSWYQPYLND